MFFLVNSAKFLQTPFLKTSLAAASEVIQDKGGPKFL